MYVVVFLQWSQLGYRRRNLNCPLRSLCFRVWYSLISIIFTKLLLLSQFIIQSFCIYMPCIKWCWFGGGCHVLHDEEMYDWWEDIVYCMMFVWGEGCHVLHDEEISCISWCWSGGVSCTTWRRDIMYFMMLVWVSCTAWRRKYHVFHDVGLEGCHVLHDEEISCISWCWSGCHECSDDYQFYLTKH